MQDNVEGNLSEIMFLRPLLLRTSLAISARRILILGILAGHIDVLSFSHLGGLFASAMTGNTTHLSFALLVDQHDKIVPLLAVISSFVLSAFIASLLRLHFGEKVGVALMTLLLVLAQMVLFAPHVTWLEYCILPSLMAMQGETIARFSGNSIQTIVISTNILKCLSAFATHCYRFFNPSSVRAPQVGAVILPLLSWFGFAAGAAIGATAILWSLPLPFLWPFPWLVMLFLDVAYYGQS